MGYLNKHVNLKPTQREPLDSRQVQNAAGGYVYAIPELQQVQRFLVLGTEGGTMYESERDLTKQNLDNLKETIQLDGEQVVKMIVETSEGGKARKNDMALLALALCMTHGDTKTKNAAEAVYTRVARTGTHHFQFVNFIDNLRGWGESIKRMVGSWYTEKSEDQLAYQCAKYRNREGWTHRDVLRRCHVGENTPLYRWITHNDWTSRDIELWVEGADADGKPVISKRQRHYPITEGGSLPKVPRIIDGFMKAQEIGQESEPDRNSVKAICHLIEDYGLTHEMIPTQFLKEKEVWVAMLPKMPITACLRNLGRMSALGILEPFSDSSQTVLEKFTKESVRKARLHPLTTLIGMKTYESGSGVKGSLKWKPNGRLVSLLEDVFYWGFENIEPSGKKMLLALDTSGSMFAYWYSSKPVFAACPSLYPGEIAAVMAMVTARVEPNYHICAFDDAFHELAITEKMSLKEVMHIVSDRPHGATDCALPMIEAARRRWDVDAFVIYTDNETWHGDRHPASALAEFNKVKDMLVNYRDATSNPSKMVTVSMTPTGSSVIDPDCPFMFDFVGMSTDTPRQVSMFINGEI